MKQITSKCTSKYVIAMFCILTELVKMKPAFLKVFEQSALVTKTTRHISNSIQSFLDIFVKIERAVSPNELVGHLLFESLSLTICFAFQSACKYLEMWWKRSKTIRKLFRPMAASIRSL